MPEPKFVRDIYDFLFGDHQTDYRGLIARSSGPVVHLVPQLPLSTDYNPTYNFNQKPIVAYAFVLERVSSEKPFRTSSLNDKITMVGQKQSDPNNLLEKIRQGSAFRAPNGTLYVPVRPGSGIKLE